MNLPAVAADAPRVYLAGPEVFLPDAEAVLARKRAVCARLGLVGVAPLTDAPAPAAAEAMKRAFAISAGNEALIRSCIAVIANLTPFRGASADAGTVYELGFARGLGLGLYAYTNDPHDYAARAIERPDGLDIEDFGLSDNLMLEGGIAAAGGVFVRASAAPEDPWRDLGVFETCARAASRRLTEPALARR
ncbi:nucleoside 2-deoxyribosyltransferase [Elioraea sp.]|uniref:nucleoside 2-deoxyribosyltransferase n=1 Tax=Elioraea sp. TaxID=2185103 RepID=UPI0021DBAAA9|nr:nucleoside 2-deoxyribosyltransferase [Elioraea sp.]GIX11858.1 MAG: nucleoside 2-deoxyribosyltransferase [Elioraea sp.]